MFKFNWEIVGSKIMSSEEYIKKILTLPNKEMTFFRILSG